MQSKANLKRQLLFFFAFSVIEYLIFHLIYVFTDSINSYALFPIRLSLSVFPVTAAAALAKDKLTFKAAMVRAVLISLMRTLASLLYSYMFIIYATTLRTGEAIMLSPLMAILLMLAYFLLTLACYGLIRLGFVIRGASYGAANEHFPISVTDLKNPVSLGIAFFPLAIFTFELVSEVIGTVRFFLEYGSSIRTVEIIYLVFSYLFILIKLVISVLIPALLVNRLMKNESVQ